MSRSNGAEILGDACAEPGGFNLAALFFVRPDGEVARADVPVDPAAETMGAGLPQTIRWAARAARAQEGSAVPLERLAMVAFYRWCWRHQREMPGYDPAVELGASAAIMEPDNAQGRLQGLDSVGEEDSSGIVFPPITMRLLERYPERRLVEFDMPGAPPSSPVRLGLNCTPDLQRFAEQFVPRAVLLG